MKKHFHRTMRYALVALLSLQFASRSRAAEEGFVELLDDAHAGNWKQCGPGGFHIKDGVATAYGQDKPQVGVCWYAGQPFRDFVLRAEFKLDGSDVNSGLFVRFPDPGDDRAIIDREGYEIDIYHGEVADIIGAHKATGAALVPDAWNTYEVTAVGQHYTIKVNGQLVNDYTGNRHIEGYVGLQNWRTGGVQFRHVQIKALTGN